MKSRKLHIKADEYLLGYSNPFIHQFIDAAVKFLGPQHRQINHILPIVDMCDDLYGDKGAKIALLHILLDMDIIDSKYIELQLPKRKKK